MTTVLTTTRLWDSDDSVESIANRYHDPSSKFRNRKNKILTGIQPQERSPNINCNKKSGKIPSRTNLLAVPKRCSGDQKSTTETNGVKKSALLYEITERTNRLARPKPTSNSPGPRQPSRISLPTSRTASRLSERVCELSRPKTYYNPPEKPPGYIAPSALRAVATRRIAELATPRKTKSPRPRKRNIIIHGPCSSRISYLARPKHPVDAKGRQKNYLKKSQPSEILAPPWRLPETRVWRELGYSTNVVKNSENKDRRSKKRLTRTRRGKYKESRPAEPSQSDCSVFSFGVKNTAKLVHRKKKMSRFKTSRLKRRKYSINNHRYIGIN